MSIFNSRLVIPGGYGMVTTEPINSGTGAPTSIGIVGAANSGPMESVLTFTDAEELFSTLGNCEAVDYIRTSWSNGGGLIKFVRVGNTHPFAEVWMDQAAGTATDITDLISREFGSYVIFDTGAQDWLYVGADTTFDSVTFDLTSGVTYGTAAARTISVEYWNGTAWSAAGILVDGTVSASQTLRQSGTIQITLPNDWVEVSAPITGDTASTYFWLRLRCNESAPTDGATARLVVEDKNALPAYGFILQDRTFTGNVQSSAAPSTQFVHEAGNETNFDSYVAAGDTVTNVTDGSTATIVSVTDGSDTVTTTALSGGYNNGFYPAATAAGVASEHLIVGVSLSTVAYDGTNSTVTVAGANFITNRVASGDILVNTTDNNTTSFTEATILSVLSETTIIISGDASGWDVTPATDVLDVRSARVLTAAAGNFAADGLRPGQLITLSSGGICIVQSVISDTVLITGGISGGTETHFDEALTYSYSKAADVYSVAAKEEKAYLEAKEPGVDGRDITVQVSQLGTAITVLVTMNGYEETYQVSTTNTAKLLTVVNSINASSNIITAEILTGIGNDDLPSSMSATPFTGGNNGSATDEDYIIGLDKLLSEEDIAFVYVAADYTDSINAALKAHVETAASINYQLPRRALCAKPEEEDFLRVTAALQNEASALSFEGRTDYIIQRATVSSVSSGTGLLTSRTAFVAAAAGRFAGLPAATPGTNKELNVISVDKVFNRSEKTNLLNYGILIADQDANGITMVRSVTPTVNSIYYESSVRRAVDVTEVTVRRGLARLYVGQVAEPDILNQIRSSAKNILDSLVKVPGQPGATLRSWRNLVVSFDTQDSTRINISYEVLPLTPINFIFTSMFVHSGISFEI